VTGPDFDKHELIPVIAQDDQSGDVLMLAYMNREAYDETLRTGRVCYWSRSRQKLWRKGEESGNVQRLKRVYFDCDADTLLVRVEQIGERCVPRGVSELLLPPHRSRDPRGPDRRPASVRSRRGVQSASLIPTSLQERADKEKPHVRTVLLNWESRPAACRKRPHSSSAEPAITSRSPRGPTTRPSTTTRSSAC
jgi:phosphoribosyl-AMP cyclohydrolase